MPANLPPQYYEAEKGLRSAKTAEEKIMALEEMLAIMPKHKGTDHLRAELRAKIAKLSDQSSKKSSVHKTSLVIHKEGAGQVVVVGLPNAGKSQLVGSVTNASLEVADYPFTTHTATPGMMEFENIKIQLIDTPALAPQTIEFWLRHLIIRADALLVLVDLGNDPLAQMDAIIAELANMRIGLGAPKAEEVAILNWKKALIVGNKLDLPNAPQAYATLETAYKNRLPVTAISAEEKLGLEELKLSVYKLLNIIRVYTKMPGQKPDLHEPIVLDSGSKVEDAVVGVHKDFLAKLKYARVWGSGKHDGIMVKRDHVLQDGDIIELHV
jgi:ribosome-interacting GTPase 1